MTRRDAHLAVRRKCKAAFLQAHTQTTHRGPPSPLRWLTPNLPLHASVQIASEALKGRVFEVSLADLQKVGVQRRGCMSCSVAQFRRHASSWPSCLGEH